MNIDDENISDSPDNDHLPSGDDTASGSTNERPLGYWLRVVDGLLTAEFATALQAEGLDRRDWMLLNVVSGDVDAPGLSERLARKGKRLRGLEDRGWIEQSGDGTWALTDTGRAERARIGEIVDGIRARVVDAVGAEAYATTMSSLEAIARELGWDDTDPTQGFRGFRGFGGPRPFRPEIRFGFGPNRHHGFEPGRPGHPGRPGTWDSAGYEADAHDGCRDQGWRGVAESAGRHSGFGPHGHGGHGHHRHGDHGGHHRHGGHRGDGPHGQSRGRGEHRAQDAYERGFDAGFARGREAGAA
jgi:hypothetical protein